MTKNTFLFSCGKIHNKVYRLEVFFFFNALFERKRERALLCWLISQMRAVAGAGPRWKPGAKEAARISHRWQGGRGLIESSLWPHRVGRGRRLQATLGALPWTMCGCQAGWLLPTRPIFKRKVQWHEGVHTFVQPALFSIPRTCPLNFTKECSNNLPGITLVI